MFKTLRNRLIIQNVLISAMILLATFTGIYLMVGNSAADRAGNPPSLPTYSDNGTTTQGYSDDVSNYVDQQLSAERSASQRSLLFTLILTGLLMEVVVAIVSYFLAEEAIKPVQEAYENQKVFIANASHELKTPVAAIQANLEAADIKNNRWIDNISAKTENLSQLVQSLVTLTKTDSVGKVEPATEVNLSKTLRAQLKAFEPQLAAKKAKSDFENTAPKDHLAKLNKSDFTQLFNILLDNAVKYCDKSVSVTVAEKSVKVTNDGATIPPESLPHIFDRFYQTDKSKNGVGLGLAIARSLAERNHWELRVSSGNGQTTFEIKF